MRIAKATPPMDTMGPGGERLPRAQREALGRYPWPLPTRIAGYVIIGAAWLALIAHEAAYHRASVMPTVLLMALILAGYHLVSGAMPPLRPSQALVVVNVQTICAATIPFMVDGQGAAYIPLYILVGEIQLLASPRAALAGTLGLGLVALVIQLLMDVEISQPVTMLNVASDSAVQLVSFVFVITLTRSAVTEVLHRHKATILVKELSAAHAQLQARAESVEALTVARERNRLAGEIHDTVGHYLTIINVQIEAAQKLSTRDAARSRAALATAKELASDCLAEVRRSVAALRPAALDDVALPEAIGRLVDDLRRASGVTIHVESQGTGTLPQAVDVAVYRVIQEAFTNVRKHAHARHVWLRTEWGPDWFTASVRDDGVGAFADQLHGDAAFVPSFGVRSMHERVAAVGGTLDVTTAPGAGFSVLLRVPCSTGVTGVQAEQGRVHAVAAP